jgi:N-acetylglucosaminyldiphosphoundecaprenol N-acetyl-beta-D-mannosaminyltransferase
MEIIKTINVMAPDVLWVGIGCPKQELWMHDHKEKLNVPIMVGVGAAFDFLAGTKPQAPAWMRNNGFEWLFRLMTEPKRLWRRYLVNNTLFIYHVGMELLSRFFNLQQTKSKQ